MTDADYSDIAKRADAIGARTKRGTMRSYGIDIDAEMDKLKWSVVYADNYKNTMGFDEFYSSVVPILRKVREL